MQIEKLKGMVEMLLLTVEQKSKQRVDVNMGTATFHKELGKVEYASEIRENLRLLAKCLEDPKPEEPPVSEEDS